MSGRRVSYYKKKFFFSIRERMLLHLSEYTIYENELEAPDELTQFGIADVVLAGRSTCSKILQEMEDKGWLYGRRAHVPSGKIRRTVYFLTPRGQIQAGKVREKVERTVVKVRRPSGEVKRIRVVDIPAEIPVYATVVDVVCHISRGVFDVESFADRMKARRQRAAYLGAMPRLRQFFDRKEEQRVVGDWLKSSSQKVLILHGLPGVGKTTLAGKVVTSLKEEVSTFWYAFHEWSTLRNVVHEIGEFLARLSKKDLLMYTETHEVLDIADVFFLLEKNLEGLRAVLVFDDYDKTRGELDDFFSAFKDMLERLDGPKIVMASHKVPKFYDRRDVKVRNLVAEVPVEGLDRQGARTMLTLKNIPESEFERVYAETKGHPLFMELIQGPEVTGTRDIDKFLEEELFTKLLDVERRVLSLASVFRKPVHADALFLDDDVDFIVITSLSDQSLLKESTPKMYHVHDLVKSFFYGRLSPTRRKRYHRWAARFYTSRGAAGDLIEAQYHFLQAGNIESAARSAIKHGRKIIDSGYQDELSKILDELEEGGVRQESEVELRLLRAHIGELRGERDRTLSIYASVVEDGQKLGKAGLVAEAWRNIGEIHLGQGDYDAAQKELERSLGIYSDLGDLDGQAEVYYSLGFLRNMSSEFMDAYRDFRKGMRLVLRTGNEGIMAKLLYGFGVNYGQRGNYKKSVSYKTRAMNILEKVRDIHQLAKVYIGLGAGYYELDEEQEALRFFHKAIEFSRLTGDRRILAYALQNAASVHIYNEDYNEAKELIEQASEIFHGIGEKRKIGWSQLYTGMIDFAEGRADTARDAWSAGLKQLEAVKDRRGIALFNLTLARVHLDSGNALSAEKHLNDAERAARQMENGVLLERVEAERSSIDLMLKEERVGRELSGASKAS